MLDLLEPLDDPVPFEVTPDLVAAARTRGVHLRRRRRLGFTAAILPVVLVLAVLAGAVYVERRTDGVHRLDVAAGVLATPVAGQPYTILVVGTDGPRLDVADTTGRHTDTQMLVHVDPAAGRVSVLALPRDLVPGAATSGADRLNNRFSEGGADALIRAIHGELGIEIAHYVEVDFQGFERLVDLTGLSVQSVGPLRDLTTGLALDGTCQRLDGAQALGLVRSRHVEQLIDGRWVEDSSGDLGRIQRQQLVLATLAREVMTLPDDPVTLDGLIDVFADNTTIDAGFSRRALLELARWGRSLDPNEDFSAATLPVEPLTLPDGSVGLRPAPAARATVAAFERGESAGATGDQPVIQVMPRISACS